MYYVYESQGGQPDFCSPPPPNETMFAVVYSSHNIHVELIIVLLSLVLHVCIASGGHSGGTSGADPSAGCV